MEWFLKDNQGVAFVCEVATLFRRPFPRWAEVSFACAFGIFMPLVCLYFDPIVFRVGDRGGMFPEYRLFAYATITLGIVTLSLWLAFRAFPAFLGGMMLCGGLFALALGLQLLPLSVIGMLFLIGFLGFTPLLTALVFLRCAWAALSTAWERRPALQTILLAVAGVAIGVSLPIAFQAHITAKLSQAAAQVRSPDPDTAAVGVRTLRLLAPLTDLDQLVWAYGDEADEARKERLASAYLELTGTSIHDRLVRLRD